MPWNTDVFWIKSVQHTHTIKSVQHTHTIKSVQHTHTIEPNTWQCTCTVSLDSQGTAHRRPLHADTDFRKFPPADHTTHDSRTSLGRFAVTNMFTASPHYNTQHGNSLNDVIRDLRQFDFADISCRPVQTTKESHINLHSKGCSTFKNRASYI